MSPFELDPRAAGGEPSALAAHALAPQGEGAPRSAGDFEATASALQADSVAEHWRLLDLPPAWVIVLVVLPLAAAVATAAYWRESVPRRARPALIGLRFASLLLLLFVLARPVKVRQKQDVQPAEVIVLVDDSASMAETDDYAGDDEARQALAAFADGGTPAARTRSKLATAALKSRILPHLEARGYVARLQRFAEAAQSVSDLARLEATGAGTHLGDSLRQSLASHRGRHVTDVILVTDGRSTGGSAAEEAAASAGLPIHAVMVGDARPERNVSVELVKAPEFVLEGDEVELAFRVTERGGEGDGREASIVLEELPASGRGEPVVVAREEVELDAAGNRVVLVARRGALEPGSRLRKFRARVEPVEGERNVDDNQLAVSVRVDQERVRVLYVEGYPRYEYRFLNFMLKRSDARIDIQMYLLSATVDFPQDHTPGLPPLKRVPTGRKELLDNYDVVILGDVNPYAVSPDPAEGEQFVASLREFVAKGGGLCIIAGQFDMPRAVAGTDFAKLLPIELDRGAFVADIPTDVEHRPRLENPAAPHQLVRLEDDVEANRALWESPRGMRGFFWHYPVTEVKPGADVLLRHPTATNGPKGQGDPLLVLGYYPAGRVLFLAIESTNRWQFRFETKYFEGFWRNALRWLALGRMKGGDRRFRLDPLRAVYDLADRVTLEARVLDKDFLPAELESQEIQVSAQGEQPTTLTLAAVPGRPGVFRGTFLAERPGRYVAWIDAEGQRVTATEFNVELPSRETADPRPDPDGLATVARLSGGQFRPLHRVDEVLAAFPGGEERREPISAELEDAWDRWATLLAALTLLCVEWVLRKRYELV